MFRATFKKVMTKEERETFHQVKRIVWEGAGYDMEYAQEGSDLFIAYVNDAPGGTFEFIPYPAATGTFMRNLFDDVVTEDMTIMELDSFAVLPEYRGKLGRELLKLMIHYAKTNGYSHGIGLTAPSTFKSFHNTYHIRCEQVKETMWYKGDNVIPTVYYLKEVYDNLNDEKYAWFTTPTELKEEVIV